MAAATPEVVSAALLRVVFNAFRFYDACFMIADSSSIAVTADADIYSIRRLNRK